MSFEEMLEQGRRVAREPEDCARQMRSLLQDPRTAALLGWLELRRDQFLEAGSEQKMAPHHGNLAHCMGSVFAYRQIFAELKHLYEAGASGKKEAQRRD